MTRYLLAYGGAAASFFALDMLWLGVVAKQLYRRALGDLMRPSPSWGAAGTFYVIFFVGLVIFGIRPALERGSVVPALVYGGLFGLFTYATYDLTNLAVLRGWPLGLSFIDIAWGVVVSATAAAAGYAASTLAR